MLLRREALQEVSKLILQAVDTNGISDIVDTLELKVVGTELIMCVTNKEYFVEVKVPVTEESDLHATVNANLFLKLIAQITTDTIELTTENSTLFVKGNGTYKIPLIYDNEKLFELPRITINNPTTNFKIKSSIFHSINNFNSKELTKGLASRPVQKLYYIDEKGCITFTTGACVNTFELPQPIKFLLNARVVKLLKLFNTEEVDFTLGIDQTDSGLFQTKVEFKNPTITLTTILVGDNELVNSVPADAIRGRAESVYPYSVIINRKFLLEALSRLLLFTNATTLKSYSKLIFGPNSVTINAVDSDNKEEIPYTNACEALSDNYTAILDLIDLKLTLDNCTDEFVTLNFGDETAFVMVRHNIKNVIPECSEG